MLEFLSKEFVQFVQLEIKILVVLKEKTTKQISWSRKIFQAEKISEGTEMSGPRDL